MKGKRKLKESRKRTGATISGLVRKYLPEIEKRMIEGESRDHVLDWLKAETGREIERTAFLSAFYRARKWAEKEQMKVARIAAFSVPDSPVVATQHLTQKKPKKEKKPEPQVTEEKPDYLALLKAYKATEKKSDPIEIIKRLRAEGKIK